MARQAKSVEAGRGPARNRPVSWKIHRKQGFHSSRNIGMPLRQLGDSRPGSGGIMRFHDRNCSRRPAALRWLLRSAQQITGAGSTFVYPILSKWSDTYSKQTASQLNYQSIGSGGGIAQIKAATVEFGASDAPLPPDQLAQTRPGAVSDRDRRRRAGRESRRYRSVSRAAALHRSAAGRHLPRQDQEVE